LALLRITDMRTLVVLILLAAAGYYFYTRHGQATTQQTGDVLPAEIAWRAVTRDDRAFVTQVEVVAVSGSRWRVEAKSPSKPNTVVVVCDGSTTAASVPQSSAASFDPRPSMRFLLTQLRRATPEATEEIAGRRYLRFTDTFNGASIHMWADSKTRFPYRLRAPAQHTDITYTILPAPSARDTGDLFSVRALTPLLSRYSTTQ
jgi:hypothetical protein